MADHTLVIVESAAKAKTIAKFLGKNYRVKASVGHIRDLPKSKLGIDVNNNFEPQYITIRGKGEILKEIRNEAKKSSRVLLATDPDREGEAIAWHLQNFINIPEGSKCRIEFNEITSEAIKRAIKNSRPVDVNLVNAQQARRVLDRLVGYNLSPLLWSKVRKGLSAGRVQSVVVKVICEREKEIQDFKPEEYWTIEVLLSKDGSSQFSANLLSYRGRKLEIKNASEQQKVADYLQGAEYILKSLEKRKTNTAQTTFHNQYPAARGFEEIRLSPSRTMRVAQEM